MKVLACIFVGAGVGAVARYGIQQSAAKVWANFPMGTLLVNLIGCFTMGILLALWSKSAPTDSVRGLLGIGLLGGFTTFSAFSAESLALFQKGVVGTALAYIALSSVGCVLACAAGFSLWMKVRG